MIGLIKGTARQLKTVSGLPLPIASYKSNSKLPIQNLSLSINPTQSGSGDPAPDNIRPITGVSEENVYRTGKNLIGMASLNKGSVVVTDGVATGTSNQFKQAFDTPNGFLPNFPFKPNTVYSFSADVKYEASTSTSYGLNIRALYTDGTYENMKRIPLNTPDYVRVGGVSASNKTLKAIYCAYNSGASNQLWMKNVQIEEASLPTDYEAYQGNTYTIALGNTYYGATLDVTSGKLVCNTWYHIYTTAKLYGNYGPDNKPLYYFETDNPNIVPAGNANQSGILICNYFKKTTGSTSANLKNNEIRTQESANSNRLFFRWDNAESLSDINTAFSTTPLQVILELATPIEIDLTPTQINFLLGSNNIWHDGNGDVEVLKFQDRQLYFGR